MKILYVATDPYPQFRNDVKELFAEQLVSLGWEVNFVMPDSSTRIKTRLIIDKSGRTRLCPNKGALGTLGFLRVVSRFLVILHEAFVIRPQFVVVRDQPFLTVFVRILCLFLGSKCVFWMSYPYGESKLAQVKKGASRMPLLKIIKGYLLIFGLYRLALPMVNHAFVQSDKMLTDLVSRGIDEKKLMAVPMGFHELYCLRVTAIKIRLTERDRYYFPWA